MRLLLLQVGLVGLGGAAGWGMQQEMGVVKQAAKARPQRVDRPELAVPHGCAQRQPLDDPRHTATLLQPQRQQSLQDHAEYERTVLGLRACVRVRACRTPGYHLRTRGEWIKRSYGEHSDAHHRQRYSHGAPPSDAAMGPRARRRAQTTVTKVLTAENTAPLQIAVDFSGMYSEATEHAPSFAQPYTGCFAEGDWFKWNYPESSSPPCTNTCAECKAAGAGSCDTACVFPGSTAPCGGSDAVDTRTFSPTNPDGVLCNRQYDPSAQDCWGVCLREDVITDEIRTFMKSEVESVVAEVEALFRVRQRAGNMVLANSKGVYSRLYESMEGVETDAECAKDARVLYRMPVADSYCTAGVDADVIFMPFMSQHVPNVAGFGGDAGKDQYGRPVLITMGWGMGGWGTTTGQQNLRATARAVIMHELVHGLGFNIFVFQNTYGYDGWSRTIVRQMPVQDTDGTADSSVWHAVGERVIAVARAYFQCNETEWPGMALPLMGENPLGDTSRGSHWETRIMKDEFLAYGGGDVVSAFTLAMMEDLGHYIGDYSRVGQMSWGRGQGCSFIYWRCGDRADDYTKTTAVAVSASAECHATHSYGSSTGPLAAQLTRKCLRPPGVVDGVVKRCAQVDWTACCDSKCNSECVTNPATTLPPDHPTLVVPPIGDGIPAAGEKYSPSITSGSSTVVLGFGGSILLMLLLALFVSLYLHLDHYLCILRLSMTISVIFVGFGCGVAGVCIYVLNDAIIIKFVSRDLVIAGLIGGIIFSLLALLGLWGATRTHTHGTGYVMTIYWMIMFTVLVAEIFIIFSLDVWIDDVSQASTDTSQQFESSIVARTRDSDSAAEGEGSLVGNVVTEIEGFACRTYKSCCWTYAPNQTACTQTHAGSSVGSAAAAQQDPSAPNFCAQVTGSKTTDDGSADMLCNTL